jgi:hypothetical protein
MVKQHGRGIDPSEILQKETVRAGIEVMGSMTHYLRVKHMRRAPGFAIINFIHRSLEGDGLLRSITTTKNAVIFETADGVSWNTLLLLKAPGNDIVHIDGDHGHLRVWLKSLAEDSYRQQSFWSLMAEANRMGLPEPSRSGIDRRPVRRRRRYRRSKIF